MNIIAYRTSSASYRTSSATIEFWTQC